MFIRVQSRVVRKYICTSDDRISMGRFRKLVLRISTLEKGGDPFVPSRSAHGPFGLPRNVKSSCEGVDGISKARTVFENKPHANDALSSSNSFSLSFSLSCGNAQNRFGPRLDDGTLFRNQALRTTEGPRRGDTSSLPWSPTRMSRRRRIEMRSEFLDVARRCCG